MQVDKDTINFIKDEEGFSRTPYICSGSKTTIGYGHVILPTDGNKYNDGITMEEAESLLASDIAKAIHAVDDLVLIKLNKNQMGAVVSLVFNIGINAFRNSTLLRKINSMDFIAAEYEFGRWVYVTSKDKDGVSRKKKSDGGKKHGYKAGLVGRRAREAKLFSTPVTATPEVAPINNIVTSFDPYYDQVVHSSGDKLGYLLGTFMVKLGQLLMRIYGNKKN